MAGKTTLDMFVPEDRRQALVQGKELPTRSFGAVVFMDISGFTRLAGTFTRELGSQRGAEALTRLLDPIYSEMVTAIHAFRGSVIVISGDGFTCWFGGDDGRRATTCAFAVQQIVSRYESFSIPGGQTANIGVKIAISVGVAQRYLVGDSAVQLLEVLAGQIVNDVTSIHSVLEKGDVAIGIDLLDAFGDGVTVLDQKKTSQGHHFAIVEESSILAEPSPWDQVQSLGNEIARQWIYRVVYDRIEDEEIEFLTELRRVVPMFVSFTGIDYDGDELAGDKLDRVIRCMQSVLEFYEGFLCQLAINGDGGEAYISFGAPTAHEDDVSRALAASLRLQNEIAALGFVRPIRIGLTQGQLWAGAHGGEGARTYSVIGFDVNLAQRLMSGAEPGQIRVSPHVLENAPDYLFERLPPENFKGIEKPMLPSLLIGRAMSHNEFSEKDIIFGRVAEREFLAAKIAALSSSAPSEPIGVILVEGEAGIGKSRLLADFMARAVERGIRLLYGEGDPVEYRTQYYAFRPILQAVFKLSESDDAEAMREKILLILETDAYLLERAPLFGEILPLYWPDNELTSQMTGEARAESIRAVVLGVLKNVLVAQDLPLPAMIVLDDAHWLDFASWNLLGYLVSALPAMLFVASMRPLSEEEAGSLIIGSHARLLANPATRHLQLASLSLGDLSLLIEHRLGVRSLPIYVLEFILTRSQGNPFFAEQIAYALRDADFIRVEHGEVKIQFAAKEINAIDFPATMQGIITSRIDRLSPSQQLTLKVASVIGRVFLIRILATVHPAKVERNALADQMSSLTRLGITEQDLSSQDLSYLFKHIITQEVVYGLLTFAQRKQLHCKIAEWYERNHTEDRAAFYSRLAHHWLNGQVLGKAIDYLEKAGQQSLELFSNEDVNRFILTAIELDEKMHGMTVNLKSQPVRTLRRARWERMLGTANLNLGRLSDSIKHYREALELLGHPIPTTSRSAGLSLLKEILIQAYHRFLGTRATYAQGSVTRAVDLELAENAVAETLFYSQETMLLAWAILFRLNVAERVGLTTACAREYAGLILIATFVQSGRLIQLYRRLAWQAVEDADRISLKINVRLLDGVASFINCEWERADEYLETGMQLADKVGDLRSYASLAGAWTGSLHHQGRYKESIAVWADVYNRLVRKDVYQNLAWALHGEGFNLLMLGHVEDGLPKLLASLDMLKKSVEDKILVTSVYGALSLANYRTRQYDLALEYAIAHEQHASAPSGSSLLVNYFSIIESTLGLYSGVQSGQIHFSTPDKAHINRLAERISNLVNIMRRLPVNKSGVWLYKGIHARLRGDQRAAAANLQISLQFARRFSQPFGAARACFEIGQLPSLGISAQQAHLSEACAIFERLGANYDLDLARTALAQFES